MLMIDLRAITALGSRDDAIGGLADRELSPLFRFMLRARLTAVPLLLLLAGLLLAYDPRPWKVALVLGGAGVMVALGIRDRHHLHTTRLPPRRAIELLGSVMIAHAILIALSGGIHSPFVVVLPVVMLLSAIAVGRRRMVGTMLGLAVAFVWLVAADDVVGSHRLIPQGLARVLPQLGGPAFALVMATVLSIVLAAAVVFGLVVRGSVERAIEAAREARAETLATLRDQNQELWTLSGAIAHELKNPLASVRGLGSLLARRTTPGTKEAERMAVMLEEVERMGSIIDEFLNFSRPLTAMTRREVDPQAVVDKVLALHRPLAEASGVRLEAGVQTSAALDCDPRKLTQVLVNLLHNAIEASPPGGVVRLTVVPEGDAPGVRFEVTDQGPGVDPAIRPRLFQPGATTKPAGSGIGLTVARAIAEQHGGTLELGDHPDGGCRAVLVLPTAREPEPSA
ncbi:MAG: HAMP domain-containing histidine kinase [Myxococcales bacterium]|nr:HAMP domain-containing histidine kinase [Myxococcales bacterium]